MEPTDAAGDVVAEPNTAVQAGADTDTTVNKDTAPETQVQSVASDRADANTSTDTAPAAQSGADTDATPNEEEEQRKKRAATRRKIAEEMFSSENVHHNTMLLVLNEYLLPLRDADLLPEKKLKVIFQNVEEVEQVSGCLCAALGECTKSWSDDSGVADCFTPLLQQLASAYTSYMENYDKAIRLMISCKEDKDKFAQFLEEVKRRPAVDFQARDLESLLVTPIQRVPRYLLLLREYLKFTDSSHPDYAKSQEVSKNLKKMTSTVNASIRYVTCSRLRTIQVPGSPANTRKRNWTAN
eukprot:TRINITY_DN2721_c0_g1_i2.p1 TRINITY_DN2721_c0_g1~~TRINITY_DN2721_c0_g1_i2.p1  ORF type:complete len:297 (-),score=94.30 TRINITY_DN2721_c0_g1_i2:74-964(-)